MKVAAIFLLVATCVAAADDNATCAAGQCDAKDAQALLQSRVTIAVLDSRNDTDMEVLGAVKYSPERASDPHSNDTAYEVITEVTEPWSGSQTAKDKSYTKVPNIFMTGSPMGAHYKSLDQDNSKVDFEKANGQVLRFKNSKVYNNVNNLDEFIGDTEAPIMCADGDVMMADTSGQLLSSVSGDKAYIPWIKHAEEWYPICGHYFWDNNDGASTFCRKLGFHTGSRSHTRQKYSKDAMPVGKCSPGQSLTQCSGGGNAWGSSGSKGCGAGKAIGVKIKCSGGTGNPSSCKKGYHLVKSDAWCIHSKWMNLASDSTVAQCAAAVASDSSCGSTFYGKVGRCSCVPRRSFCYEYERDGDSSIYALETPKEACFPDCRGTELDATHYAVYGIRYSTSCPSGSQPIADAASCKAVSEANGLIYNFQIYDAYSPGGCVLNIASNDVFFNTYQGREQSFDVVICRQAKATCSSFSGCPVHTFNKGGLCSGAASTCKDSCCEAKATCSSFSGCAVGTINKGGLCLGAASTCKDSCCEALPTYTVVAPGQLCGNYKCRGQWQRMGTTGLSVEQCAWQFVRAWKLAGVDCESPDNTQICQFSSDGHSCYYIAKREYCERYRRSGHCEWQPWSGFNVYSVRSEAAAGGATSTCAGMVYGDRFIQVGDWRIGDVDGSHASIAHKDRKTAQIFRSDGTLHNGPRADYTTWSPSFGTLRGISFGDRFIQIGDWRIGDVDGTHASIAHKDGKTAQIFRNDGTLHNGPRDDYTTWSRSIGAPSGISFGDRFIQIGDWRIGDVDGRHASMAHKDGETAQIYRNDGTLHPGPRNDYTTWNRVGQTCEVSDLWFLGAAHESCSQVCASLGKACTVNSEAQMRAAAKSAAALQSTLGKKFQSFCPEGVGGTNPTNDVPFRWEPGTNCEYGRESFKPTCAAAPSHESARRICFCEEAR